MQQACDQALGSMAGADPSFALLFTWRLDYDEGRASELLAARLPPSCAVVGCLGSGIIGTDGLTGQLVDSSSADPPPEPQQGLSLLLGRLPGRHVSAFAAAVAPAGPGAHHRLGRPIAAEGGHACTWRRPAASCRLIL